MTKKVVTFGEIMLRLATPEHQRFSQATSFYASFGGGVYLWFTELRRR